MGVTMQPQPPYLTDEEIAEICRPRTQGAAQIRYLRALGLRVERRADGTPLVWRHHLERTPAAAGPAASNEPAWQRA